MLDDVEHHHGTDPAARDEIGKGAGKTVTHRQVDDVAL